MIPDLLRSWRSEKEGDGSMTWDFKLKVSSIWADEKDPRVQGGSSFTI